MSNKVKVECRWFEHGLLRVQQLSFSAVPRIGEELCLSGIWNKKPK